MTQGERIQCRVRHPQRGERPLNKKSKRLRMQVQDRRHHLYQRSWRLVKNRSACLTKLATTNSIPRINQDRQSKGIKSSNKLQAQGPTLKQARVEEGTQLNMSRKLLPIKPEQKMIVIKMCSNHRLLKVSLLLHWMKKNDSLDVREKLMRHSMRIELFH